MTTDQVEERVMSERRPQPMPPTPANPSVRELRDDLMLEVREGAKRSAQAIEAAKRRQYAALGRAEPLMYTGETREAFYARRQPLENLWNAFLASNSSRGAVFGNDS